MEPIKIFHEEKWEGLKSAQPLYKLEGETITYNYWVPLTKPVEDLEWHIVAMKKLRQQTRKF